MARTQKNTQKRTHKHVEHQDATEKTIFCGQHQISLHCVPRSMI